MILFMAYSVLIGACAAACAGAARALLSHRMVATRWWWCAALLVTISASTLSMVMPKGAAGVSGVGRTAPAAIATEPRGASVASVPAGMSLTVAIAAAWAATSGVLIGLLCMGMIDIARHQRRAQPMTVQGAPVLLTDDVGPAVAGFTRPTVFVPRWLLQLDATTQRLMLAHEAEHARAGDARLLWVVAFMVAVFPWNPAVWWIARRLRLAIEIDCDARVLAGAPDVRAYAELLLLAARRRTRNDPMLLARFPGAGADLSRRIEAMTEQPVRSTAGRRLFYGAVALGAVIVACEAPRPEPVAPVNEFTWRAPGSKAPAELEAPWSSAEIVAYLQRHYPEIVAAGSDRQPVIVVRNAKGQILKAERAPIPSAGRFLASGALAQLDPKDIESVEVVKGKTLPPELSGGLISIVLKDPNTPLRKPADVPAAAGAGAQTLPRISVRPRR
jgi:beta-lactamase regulating signal transducer with metallopeptidase domain